ncbi:MAG: hypothetical protein WC783_04680 [Candidatus Paceibacterota bacterium]|jgi:hypothetical protein
MFDEVEDEAAAAKRMAGRAKRLKAAGKAAQAEIARKEAAKNRAIARNADNLDRILGRGKYAQEQ